MHCTFLYLEETEKGFQKKIKIAGLTGNQLADTGTREHFTEQRAKRQTRWHFGGGRHLSNVCSMFYLMYNIYNVQCYHHSATLIPDRTAVVTCGNPSKTLLKPLDVGRQRGDYLL